MTTTKIKFLTKTKLFNCDRPKNQIVRKLKNFKFDFIQIVRNLKNSNGDKTQIVAKFKNFIYDKT